MKLSPPNKISLKDSLLRPCLNLSIDPKLRVRKAICMHSGTDWTSMLYHESSSRYETERATSRGAVVFLPALVGLRTIVHSSRLQSNGRGGRH
jgi:hypothetical protein